MISHLPQLLAMFAAALWIIAQGHTGQGPSEFARVITILMLGEIGQ